MPSLNAPLGAMYIPLTQNKFTLIDSEEYEKVSQYKWYLNSTGYAVRNEYTKVNGKWKLKIILMHRVLLSAPKGKVVDHINNDSLDNRKNNLQICSQLENLRKKRMQKNNTSGYRGVSWYKNLQKWSAEIWVDRKRINLGYFKDGNEAAKAYNQAAIKYFGKFAQINIL